MKQDFENAGPDSEHARTWRS